MSRPLLPDHTIPVRLFRRKLLSWFDQHKRDLPWRRYKDPYRIWISEIMLQQTRVAAVLEYYEQFITRFPTLRSLATAREGSVLAAWSGLGYYRRARMLRAAARRILNEHSGKFPSSAAELRTLPGIGRYTSAAVASMAFNEPVAAVDGNVERLLQRVLGKQIDNTRLWLTAQGLLCQKRPGDFNQAMMELGATLCIPRGPKCEWCPISQMCVTRGELIGPNERKPQNKREISYALDCRDGSVLLVKRDKGAKLMPSMWELPQINLRKHSTDSSLTLRHSITVTNYLVRVLRCELPTGTKGHWVRKSRITSLPLTGLTRKILRAAKLI